MQEILSPWWTPGGVWKGSKALVRSRDEGKTFFILRFSNKRRSVLNFYCVIIEIEIFCNKSSSEQTLTERQKEDTLKLLCLKDPRMKKYKKFTPMVIYERLNSQTFHSFLSTSHHEKTKKDHGEKVFGCNNLKFLHVLLQRNKQTSRKVFRDLWNLKINFLHSLAEKWISNSNHPKLSNEMKFISEKFSVSFCYSNRMEWTSGRGGGRKL